MNKKKTANDFPELPEDIKSDLADRIRDGTLIEGTAEEFKDCDCKVHRAPNGARTDGATVILRPTHKP